jgi:serine acetyltransferase
MGTAVLLSANSPRKPNVRKLHMWSELRADFSLYASLRTAPDSPRTLLRFPFYVGSLGLLTLAVQRVDRHYNALRDESGWTARAAALRCLVLIGRALVIILTKSDVDPRTAIAGGVYLSDSGHLMLGPRRIGRGTIIHERVTIGRRAGHEQTPDIGENVWIGPDCVIYGDVTLADGVTVLPGTVLSVSVSDCAVVGGNPAMILRSGYDNSPLRRDLRCSVDAQTLDSPPMAKVS